MDAQADSMHKEHVMQANNLLKPGDATHTAIRSGDWTDPDTWEGGRIPGADALVYVPDAITVTYDAKSDIALDTVRVDGTLAWSRTQDTKMVVETIVTHPGSLLDVGTTDDPIPTDVDAQIVFRNTAIDAVTDPGKLGHGLVAFGEVSIHGAAKESHLTMDGVTAGATSVTLDGDTANWKVGDTLLFVGTRYEGVASWEDRVLQTQDEERVITAINSGTITFDRPLAYDHMPPDGYPDINTYVANLTRNVLFVSEDANGTRGHVMMSNGISDGPGDPANLVAYAEFRDLGRTDFTQETGEDNPLGRYSVHLHETGPGMDQAASHIIGNSVNGGLGWGITQHQSNAIITDNVVYDLVGAGIVSETGNEQGVWSGNLVSKVVGFTVRGRTAQDGLGYENNSRVIEQFDNIAANVKVGWNFMGREIFEVGTSSGDGMHRKMFERDELRLDPSPFDVAIDHQEPALHNFTGNTVVAADRGIQIFHRAFSEDSDLQSVVDDFTAWEINETAFNMMNYTSNYLLKDSLLIGTDSATTAFVTGWKTSSGILNNVEVAHFNAVYGVQGLAHEGMMIDVTTREVGSLVSTSQKTGLGEKYLSPQIVDSRGITPVEKVIFIPDSSADLIVTPDDTKLRISGITVDSLGQRGFNEYFEPPINRQISGISADLDGGNKTYHSEFTMAEFLDLHGVVQRGDGSWYSPVVNWITDRLTAEHHPVIIEIELQGFDAGYLKQYELVDFVPPKIGNPDFEFRFGEREVSDAPAMIATSPGSADDDGNMALGSGMPDATIAAGEQGAVALSLSGLDADATAIVTILDGAGGAVSAALSGDGTAVLDVSKLSGGAATTRVTATDAAGNITTVTGPGLTLDFAPDTPAPVDANLAITVPDTVLTPDIIAEPMPQAAMTGTSLADWMTGTSADDVIFGGAGRDRIRGDDGNDTLDGGAGADNLGGGAGADTFVWGLDGLDGGRDRVEDFTPGEGDIIDLTAISAAYGWDAATAQAAVSVKSSYLGVTISVDVPGTGLVSVAELRGMTPDQISVAAGTLRLVAGSQPDTSADDGGNLAITVPDTITTPDTIVEPAPDTVVTPDTVAEPGLLNAITGTSRADWMTGTSGDDLIFGGAGRDRIRGDDGNDTLNGGAGADNLGGGAGADTFVWGPDGLDGGRDRVEDFTPGEGDIIDLSAISAAYGWDAATAQAAVSVKSSYLGVTISIDAPGTGPVSVAELRGLTPDQISVAAGTLRLVSGGDNRLDTGFFQNTSELLLPEPLAADVFLF